MSERYEVVVVGAGQAGLALGYFLKKAGRRFILLEAAAKVGASWRNRWDSLTLFTPARYDSLPGIPFPAPPQHYPGKDEVADYLDRYAAAYDLPIRLQAEVTDLKREGESFVVRTNSSEYLTEQVVVATGPFVRPFVPHFGRELDRSVLQLHSANYRHSSALPAGEVLVVGGGNSGWQIAEEIARERPVYLARGKALPRVPRRLLGRSLFGWLESLGVMKVPGHSRLGRRMQENDDIVIGSHPSDLLSSGRIELLGRAVAAQGDSVHFEDGRTLKVSAVVWATGYLPDYHWIDLPIFDEQGNPVNRRGVTSCPGLYFLGLRWQHTTGSALLGWVGHDAAFIARQVERFDGKGE